MDTQNQFIISLDGSGDGQGILDCKKENTQAHLTC